MRVVSLCLSALLIAACQCVPRDRTASLDARDFALMITDQPPQAMAMLWETLQLERNPEINTWCLHRIGVAEPGPCRDLLMEYAEILLDISDFGSPSDVVAFLLHEREDSSAEDLMAALEPVLNRQFAGGKAKRLGRTLYAMRYRQMQERRARGGD